MAQRSSPFASFLAAGIVAGVLASAANLAIYLVALVLGAWDSTVVAPAGDPIGATPILLLSLIPAALGGLVGWAAIRFLPRGRTVFTVVAVAVLALMAIPPLQLGAPAAMVVLLQLMHVVAGGVTIGMVLRVDQARQEAARG